MKTKKGASIPDLIPSNGEDARLPSRRPMWRSMRVKLPALISLLFLAAVGIGSWAAYRVLQKALFETTTQRVDLAAQRLATTLAESAIRLRRDAAQLAKDPALSAFLNHADAGTRAHAQQRLDAQRAANPQVESVELLRVDRKRVLTVGAARIHAPPVDSYLSLSDSAFHGAAVSPIITVGSSAYLYVFAPIFGTNQDTLGFVAQLRLLSGQSIRTLMEGVIGSDAAILMGNISDGVWTDLSRPTTGPSIDIMLDAPLQYTSADGRSWLGIAEQVPHSPWRVWIQVPRQAVLAPARRVLFEIIVFSLVLGTAGTLGGWWLSRHITVSLIEVTQAARDFAAGEYARRAAVVRADELGELADSFNQMARRVQDTTNDLESLNEELRDGEARYRRLIELLPDGIIVHADGEVLFANDAAARLLGAESISRLLGRQVLEFIPESAQATMRERIAQNEAGAAAPLVERAIRRVDGKMVTVEMLGIPVSYDGRAAAQTVLRDVTDRKRLEQALTQSQKMEAVGRLAGGVAHDFNNLLTVISSYSAMALDTLEAPSSLRGDIEEIRAAAARAADLTRQLLAFSRKQMLQPVPLELNATVASIDKMLRRLIGEDIELVTNCAARLDTVSADPSQLEQVIVNLAVNARDAMPGGGKLTIETANVTLSGDTHERQLGVPPGNYVMLTVRDTGVGMSEETLDRIFEPFFTTKEPGKGTGLGLSTVYGIVQQSGGDISVCSTPGRGSAFRVYLPSMASQSSRSGSTAAVEESVPGSETVLVVEDETAVRSVIARVLRRAGYYVVEAGTEDEALALCRHPKPQIHLVLTDLVMPGMGGRELARKLQAHRPNVRVLFMSGYTEDAVMRHRFLEREAAFIGKPFTPEHLTSKVRELLDAA